MSVHYTVSMTEPQNHYFHVELSISGSVSDEKIRLIMPVWTPGSYLVREFARNVVRFKASDAETGSELRSYKETKNAWIVETQKPLSEVKVSYDVYAFEYTVDTSYLDTRHGVINGASIFMYVEGMERQEQLLTIIPFSEWKVIATSLDPAPQRSRENESGPNSKTFVAENFDVLLDSPIEVGNQEVRSFEVEGIEHCVSMYGPKPVASEEFVSDLKKIVESAWKVFGVIPYKRYFFLVDFGGLGTGGGLEHLSSTHCIASRFRLIPSQEYKIMMGLFSHEFFHAWNVKRMRPKGLGPFNYSSETYTKSLWIAEGITSYYEDILLRRARIYSVADYFDALCAEINQMKFLPSSTVESAEEASFNTWIKYYRPNENTPNVSSSYYVQGTIIGWMIDMEIRRTTQNASSLDDAMRRLYNETFEKENRGYTDDEFEKICNEVAGKSLSREIFDSRVRGRDPVDYDRYLGYAGLWLGPKSGNADAKKGYLGIKTKSEGARVLVESILSNSPAERASLSPGDEIISVNNLRVDSSTLPFYISNSKPGDRINILISRDGYLQEGLETCLGELPSIENRIYKRENVSEEQKQTFRHWMLDDWDKPLEYVEYAPSPVRTKPLDYF